MGQTVLKLGWEFPPYNHGGLGVACQGLVHGLLGLDTNVILILPRSVSSEHPNFSIFGTDVQYLKIETVDTLLTPYISEHEYLYQQKKLCQPSLYGQHLFQEIERYSYLSLFIAREKEFDVIHAHDWMTFKAGVAIKKYMNKPLVIHVHATEIDRTGNNNVNQDVFNIEKWGMQEADKIIAVSNYTKNLIVKYYGIDPDKISVVHNAVSKAYKPQQVLHKKGPIVLFLGRLTVQKGPDYFISAAQKVLQHRPDVMFVVVGSGYMEHDLMQWVAQSGLSDKILFTGQLSGSDIDRAYQMADVFIMPSVSEPFGLTALEAIQNKTPIIISKSSGVSEVINHCLKVDFWDIDKMAHMIISVIDHGALQHEMVKNSNVELQKYSWKDAAHKCLIVYNTVQNDA